MSQAWRENLFHCRGSVPQMLTESQPSVSRWPPLYALVMSCFLQSQTVPSAVKPFIKKHRDTAGQVHGGVMPHRDPPTLSLVFCGNLSHKTQWLQVGDFALVRASGWYHITCFMTLNSQIQHQCCLSWRNIFIQAPGCLCGLVSISVNLSSIHLLYPLFQLQDMWTRPRRLNIQECWNRGTVYHLYTHFYNTKKKRGIWAQEFAANAKEKRMRESATAVTLREKEDRFIGWLAEKRVMIGAQKTARWN